MITGIHLYCKANKRKRNDKTVGIYAYILQEEGKSKEVIQLLEEEARVARLELLALVTGLKDLEERNKLEENKTVYLYVTNEYILEELQKGMKNQDMGKILDFSNPSEYTDLWKELEKLLSKTQFIPMGLNKKDRVADDEVIKSNMGILNKMVCDAINEYFRG